jgi:hypothetical protein
MKLASKSPVATVAWGRRRFRELMKGGYEPKLEP